jgi:biopolymer transport protein ExbB
MFCLAAMLTFATWQGMTAASAQTPEAPAAAEGGAQTVVNLNEGTLATFKELFDTSPYINGTILVLSVFAVLMFVYFLMTINSSSMAPPAFVDDVNKLVLSRKNEEAANLCRSNRKVFVASVIQRCVENAGKEHSVIMGMLDSEGRRRADVVWNRISYLADVSNVAPMLGLLGTVVGMIKSFFLLGDQPGSIRSTLLSRAIGEAMSTTMFGLIVGIMALIFYSIIKSRATRVLADAEQVVHSVADHIKRGGA